VDFEDKTFVYLETKHQILKKIIGGDMDLVTKPFQQ
jgi:hypothetical protein